MGKESRGKIGRCIGSQAQAKREHMCTEDEIDMVEERVSEKRRAREREEGGYDGMENMTEESCGREL